MELTSTAKKRGRWGVGGRFEVPKCKRTEDIKSAKKIFGGKYVHLTEAF